MSDTEKKDTIGIAHLIGVISCGLSTILLGSVLLIGYPETIDIELLHSFLFFISSMSLSVMIYFIGVEIE